MLFQLSEAHSSKLDLGLSLNGSTHRGEVEDKQVLIVGEGVLIVHEVKRLIPDELLAI